MNSEDIIFIDNYKELEQLSLRLNKKEKIAVDFEAESNLHHYGIYLCLIQIADNKGIYIVDPIKIKDLSPLKEVFENPKVEKIMYSADFDVRLLYYSHKIKIVNLYDLQIAAYLLGYGKLSLKDFIMEVLGKEKDEFLDCQTSDWNIRPLSKNQITYAADDVRYLILLKKKISEEIKFKKIGSFIKIRSKKLEDVRFNSDVEPYMKIKNYHRLNKQQKELFKTFFYIRDEIAKEKNLPPYKIISNEQLIGISKKPPKNLEMWIKRFPDKTLWELEKFENAREELKK